MKTEQIEYAISRCYDLRSHLVVPNISWGLLNYEADILVVRQSGYCIEYEIKRTFSDYKKDFEKRHFHDDPRVKEFYYAFPAELWHKREGDIRKLLPKDAGVLVLYNGKTLPYTKVKKEAEVKKNCRPLSQSEMYTVARLGTLRIWNLKQRLITTDMK